MTDPDYDIDDALGEPEPTVEYARPQDYRVRRLSPTVLICLAALAVGGWWWWEVVK